MRSHAKAIVAISAMLLTFALGASSASAESPLPTMGAVSDVRGGSAHLTGSVDPLDQDSFYFFEYSTDEVNWTQSTFQGPIPAGSGPTPVTGDLSGLKASTEYFVRLSAMNFSDFVTVNSPGPNPSLTTLAIDPPGVTSIDAASDVSYTSAKASGSVERPAGEDPANDVNCRFEYVTEEQFGTSGFDGAASALCAQSPVSAEGTSAVTAELTGLTHSTTYRLRLVAENAGGSDAEEAPSTFTTLAITAPSVTLDPVSNITGEGASFSGDVDPGNPNPAFDVNSCAFEYITEAAYGGYGEIQTLTVKANGGTYTMAFEGETTAPVAFNASAATVQGALEALPNLAPSDLTVSGGPGSLAGTTPYTVSFGGAYAQADVGNIALDATNLTAPSQVKVSTPKGGFSGQDEIQRLVIGASGGTFTISFAVAPGEAPQTTAPIPFNADAATLQAALEALPNVGVGNVEVSIADPAYLITFTGALGSTDVRQVSVNQAALIGQGTATPQATREGRAPGFDGASSVPCQPETVSGVSTDVSAVLNDLQPNTAYRVRLRAESLGGVTHSAEQSFATVTQAPTAITFLVANLMPTSARLTGYTNPRNQPTNYWFEWGTDPDLSTSQSLPSSEDASAGSSSAQQVAAQDLTGLTPDTTYYYRLIAESPLGTTEGEIESFTTRQAHPAMGSGVGAFGDREIELVSAPDKNSAPIFGAAIAPDGNRVVYYLEGGTNESGFGVQSVFASLRTPSGWQVRNIDPPRSLIKEPGLRINAASKDLSSALFRGLPPINSEGDFSLYRHDYEAGTVTLGPTVTESGAAFSPGTMLVADDLSRAVNFGPDLPGDPSPEGGLYDVTTSQPDLISLLPGDVAPACGGLVEAMLGMAAEQNYISSDGSRVLFPSRGSDCSAPRQLYMREGGGAGKGTTTLLSGPVVAGDDYGADFVMATDDGSVAFFFTRSRLEARDGNDTPDIYRHTIDEGNYCVTCVVPEADVVSPGQSAGPSMAISATGSHVYFNSRRALAPGAAPGAINTYLWRASSPDEIALGPPSGRISTSEDPTAMTSEDGDALVFISNEKALDALTGVKSNGAPQYYRYSASEGSLACLSCTELGPSYGARSLTTGAASIGPSSSPFISADGDTVMFDTEIRLVPDDVNASRDVYEWRDGQVGLITDGIHVAREGFGETQKMGMTPDGKNLLFLSGATLTPGERDPMRQAFVARIGGGFPNPVDPGPAPCAGDGCRDPLKAPPADPSPITPGFTGPGNQAKSPACKKGKVKRKGRCVAKPRKQKKSPRKGRAAKHTRGGGK